MSDKEVQAVVDFLVKNSESVQYNEEITNHVIVPVSLREARFPETAVRMTGMPIL